MDVSSLLTPHTYGGINKISDELSDKTSKIEKDVLQIIRDSGGLREYARQIKEDKIREEIEKRVLEKHGISKEELTAAEKENHSLYTKITDEIESITQSIIEKLLLAGIAEQSDSTGQEGQAIPQNSPLEGDENQKGKAWVINVLV
jgi:hypothetical protein